MNYQYEVNNQYVCQIVDKMDKAVIRFGDDWPGVFLSSEYSHNFCVRLNDAYVNRDTVKIKSIIHELYSTLHFSDVNVNKNIDVICLSDAGFRVDTGHIVFDNELSGYYFRGDHAYMMKLGVMNTFESDDISSESHIPFLINESKHWAKKQ
jgi:hypothetical protein